MAISNDTEWLRSEDAAELLALVSDRLTDRRKVLIATGCIRHLWGLSPRLAGLLGDDSLRAATRYATESSNIALHLLETTLGLCEDEVGVLLDRQRERAAAGDWYEAWEIGNEITFLVRREQPAIRVCQDAVRVASQPDGLSDFLTGLPERLAELFLTRGNPLPPQLRRSEPWELPWEIFIRLRGSINDPLSILDRAVEGCRRLICDTIREIIPSPFVPVEMERAWLSEEVVHLATRMYEDAQFDQMERLGDLLQDSGCGDTVVLLHCLHSEHFRGCWLVDAILGGQ